MSDLPTFENKTYDEIKIGDEASLVKEATEQDFLIFANASGNLNNLHLSRYVQNSEGKPTAYAPPLWVASLISTVLGNTLPGVGTGYTHQTLDFGPRCIAGDILDIKVKVVKKLPNNLVEFETEIRRRQDGEVLVSGPARVIAPTKKLKFDAIQAPDLWIDIHPYFEELIGKAQAEKNLVTVVVAPEEAKSLGGAILAYEKGIITPILVGSEVLIRKIAEEEGYSLDNIQIINETNHFHAANKAIDLISEGQAAALMKGYLHTDELLRAALRKVNGLRAGRRLTHVFVLDVPGVSHPILVTDAAINIQPDLKTKRDIVQNAIDVAISIGMEVPKVGVLSAVETVNPDIPSSMDAALLSKMAERGQIQGGIVDGPLAMDNAVDIAAAKTKGITSEVAGQADILVVPNLDAGNMLAKQLAYISNAEPAGLVLGASVPIILNSRSDGDMARLASCAIASLHHARLGKKA